MTPTSSRSGAAPASLEAERDLTYREAVITALAEELDRDESVMLLGEDIGAAGGVFKTTAGLFDRFGADRVKDTPISEQAIIGCALGAAVLGLRPVAELMFADFAAVCFDQIANQVAKYHYMSGGQARAPITIRLANGSGSGYGSQHSQSVENWFLNVPGLRIAVPGNPQDAYLLLKQAIRDDNPVLVFEHKGLYGVRGPVGTDEVPFGSAATLRAGADVTIVATQMMCGRALDAATILADQGVEAEVIDLRTLVPLDIGTVLDSVGRTNRLVCVQEGPPAGGWAATVVARVVEEGFDSLDSRPRILSSDETPVPFAGLLEEAGLPTAQKIAEATIEIVNQG